MDPYVAVNFTCQRCRQPVHLDQGFSHLTELTLAELALPIHAGSEVEFEGLKLDKVVSPMKLNESSGQTHGFTIVEDPTENNKISPLKITTSLFDLLSSNTDIDHPLCEECTDHLLEVIDDYLIRTEKQTALYEQLFKSDTDVTKEDTSDLEKELEVLKTKEAHLLSELEGVEKEQADAQMVLNQCQEEKQRLEEESLNYWREYCIYKCQVDALEDENRSIKSRITHMKHQLDRLSQTNVFNDTFHIWYAGHFGTINNLRLGRLPTTPVPWPEINAAWGQTVLLLWALAKKVGFTFSKYKLVPQGNTSYIEVLGENKELPLYGSGGLRFLWDHKFDAGMVAFLECAAEFQVYVESNGAHDVNKNSRKKLSLPYRISKHYMEDTKQGQLYSIRMQFNSEEQWTKALKYLLTNLKWGLTLVSSPQFPTTRSYST